MWAALIGTGLGWLASGVVLAWLLRESRRALAAVTSELAKARDEVSSLRDHIDTQAAILRSWQAAWTEERDRLSGIIQSMRGEYHHAIETIRTTLAHPDLPAHVAGAWAASVLATGPLGVAAPASPRGSAEPGALPPVPRPPARDPSGGR